MTAPLLLAKAIPQFYSFEGEPIGFAPSLHALALGHMEGESPDASDDSGAEERSADGPAAAATPCSSYSRQGSLGSRCSSQHSNSDQDEKNPPFPLPPWLIPPTMTERAATSTGSIGGSNSEQSGFSDVSAP
mmetsp:Transcript_32039/g.63126  ORF Transcript_32039/g.63126 Transcript_32039/m.63126 type:complete len:132 (+) Transcript_32039:53-448(+)|eukprot:CAMPEP_0172738584 /NCGR_PEP_ID=MMETSP1074-20121228/120518_1 /TAXON_ID=2916 /ORGANISM="Ceratium fusus, Strain PA161109" /LENGTH=131 /DNA_ID=CAMNT_0013568239 /DNA_START=44 /DNA_END=439 /DNA_ORIENTATION=+